MNLITRSAIFSIPISLYFLQDHYNWRLPHIIFLIITILLCFSLPIISTYKAKRNGLISYLLPFKIAFLAFVFHAFVFIILTMSFKDINALAEILPKIIANWFVFLMISTPIFAISLLVIYFINRNAESTKSSHLDQDYY